MKLKIKFTTLLILGVVFTNLTITESSAAQKKTILENFVQLTYPDEIKLKSKGCQEIKFNYIVDESLPLENTVFIIQLTHKTKKIIYGYGYWFSDIDPNDGLPSMSRIGSIPMKICRKNWQTQSNTGVTKYTGIKPGNYDLYIAYGYYDGENVTDKKILREPIKLIG